MPVDLNRILTNAMELHEKLEEVMPEGAEIVAVGTCVEIKLPCPEGRDHTHTVVFPWATPESELHTATLFEEAADNAGASWNVEVED